MLMLRLGMNALRKRLVWLAGLWLCGQFAVLTTTPVSLCVGTSQAAAEVACACAHGSEAHCPMHHPETSKPGCNCRSNSPDPSSAAVLTLLGHAAVLTSTSNPVAQPMLSGFVGPSLSALTFWIVAPDGPPPRA